MSAPTYSYTSNTPNAANPMNDTQPLILANFQAINELINVNHVGFNVDGAGNHNFVSMPFPSTATTPVSTDLNMFTASTPDGPNLAEIFYENSNGIITQMSAVQPGGGTPAGTSGDGWCQFSESGLIMKWGTTTVTTVTSGATAPGTDPGVIAVYYPTGSGIPPFTKTAAYIKVTPASSPGSNAFGSFITYVNSYNVYAPAAEYFAFQVVENGTFTINWWAIGI